MSEQPPAIPNAGLATDAGLRVDQWEKTRPDGCEMNEKDVKPSSTDGSSYSRSSDEKKIGHHDQEVTRLAKQLSNPSQSNLIGDNYQNTFLGVEKDSLLDPNGPNFNARAWVKNLIGIQSRDPELYPQRTAGFSFKNLNVHGFGTATDYQKDVGNIPLQIGAGFRWFSGTGKNKIQILQGFDGVVRHGEMLVVLGRPGRYDIEQHRSRHR